jgi:SEL1 protein
VLLQREVLQYYQYSADRGNIDAQTAVGTLLNLGTHGVSRDHSAAAHYLARAAAAGNDEAMAHLGHMHGAGEMQLLLVLLLYCCDASQQAFATS